MKKYEVLYVVQPRIEEEAKAALVTRFADVLTSNGAEIIESKDWGKRRLAYEINDFKEGFYQIVKIQAENDAAIKEFDRLAKINENIIRHLIVREEA